MLDRLAAFIVGEGNWLPIAMGTALVAAAFLAARTSAGLPRARTLIFMNFFTGVTLLVMGIGHVLAVTTKQIQGTLNGSVPLLYLIGVVILVPATLLLVHARSMQSAKYNFWMAAALIVLGLINIPLAIPALLNIAYLKHTRPRMGQLVLGAWVLVNVGLFTGGMLFMLSGARTFEEFSR
ncbi:MAG TPA: hypothetical protein VNT81_15315 [Vicinamibacterales bacterium]|nr:hypothetical protein [Vicinamibacterales bacterium]